MAIGDYIDTQDFNRTSRNVADSAVKIFFKQLGAVMSFLINFIKEMLQSILGR